MTIHHVCFSIMLRCRIRVIRAASHKREPFRTPPDIVENKPGAEPPGLWGIKKSLNLPPQNEREPR